MREFLAYSIIILLVSCSNNEQTNTLKRKFIKKNVTKLNVDTAIFLNDSVDYSDSINYTDSHGRKQGVWIKKWRGVLIEKFTYKDDTLNGPFEMEYSEGVYKNGLKEGFEYHYYGKKEKLMMVIFYENGVFVWNGFPFAGQFNIIPIKDFHIAQDSVFVKAPNINGQTWYEGSFCLLPDSSNNGRLMTNRYGVHKVYYMNGNIRGIIDYDNRSIQEFDSFGVLQQETNFENTDMYLGRYAD